jgi:hypothetical protein
MKIFSFHVLDFCFCFLLRYFQALNPALQFEDFFSEYLVQHAANSLLPAQFTSSVAIIFVEVNLMTPQK